MTEIVTVTAVYENGVLRPVRRLNLCEQQTVQIHILPSEPADPPGREAERELECILESLADAGLLAPPAGHSRIDPINDQERRELAEELGRAPGKPLSQVILEDRGEW